VKEDAYPGSRSSGGASAVGEVQWLMIFVGLMLLHSNLHKEGIPPLTLMKTINWSMINTPPTESIREEIVMPI
jgi:hypothetical protein